ncbi:alpha/beta hydrolase fold domain-containing protein [Jatrophihabitans sp. YIM 134969]
MYRPPGAPRRHLAPRQQDLPRWLVRNTAVRFQRPGLGGRIPLRWQRRYLDAVVAGLAPPEGTVARRTDLAGTPALRVTVGATERPRAVLYLHGGAFMTGSSTSHKALTAHLAAAAGAVVFSLDYPLAPEHPYPAALDATVAAYRALLADGWSPSQLALAGDSAGGGLAVAACQRITALDPSDRPAALALISPAVDIREWTDPLDRRRARLDPVVRMRWGDTGRIAYVGAGDVEDPGITPVNGPLEELPPTIVHLDRDELLHDRVVDFVDRAAEAGVEIVSHEYARTWHVMHAHASLWTVARDAVVELGEFVRAHT